MTCSAAASTAVAAARRGAPQGTRGAAVGGGSGLHLDVGQAGAIGAQPGQQLRHLVAQTGRPYRGVGTQLQAAALQGGRHAVRGQLLGQGAPHLLQQGLALFGLAQQFGQVAAVLQQSCDGLRFSVHGGAGRGNPVA